MAKVEIELFQYGKLLFGKVLKQDITPAPTLVNIEGFTIGTASTPELSSGSLFLRGSRSSANTNEFHCRYDSDEAANKVSQRIIKGLAILNEEPKPLGSTAPITRLI